MCTDTQYRNVNDTRKKKGFVSSNKTHSHPETTVLRLRVSCTSVMVRAVSTVIAPPGRIVMRCFVVFNNCWTLGMTRGMKSEINLSCYQCELLMYFINPSCEPQDEGGSQNVVTTRVGFWIVRRSVTIHRPWQITEKHLSRQDASYTMHTTHPMD